MTLDDSHHGGTTDEYFSLTDLAKVIGAEDGYYGEDQLEADEGGFFMKQSSSENLDTRGEYWDLYT